MDADEANYNYLSAPFPAIVQHLLAGHRCVAMLYSLQLVLREETRAYPAVVCKQVKQTDPYSAYPKYSQ